VIFFLLVSPKSQTPLVLVGTKFDLRDQFAQNADDFKAKGRDSPIDHGMKKAINASASFECSVQTK
jgi:hypothetical protein